WFHPYAFNKLFEFRNFRKRFWLSYKPLYKSYFETSIQAGFFAILVKRPRLEWLITEVRPDTSALPLPNDYKQHPLTSNPNADIARGYNFPPAG
ncbi:MAG: hypothetical protein Q7R34_09570, partial [Dehalococcoidia bacterium]|nr:hypothetical protein [Dehalococcoidia bacterium]